eukprot:CAMPEP_0174727068 /NCGR_PEP_ID=MMETSP1094-20130205/48991_1 /TAXON_ID=156173 /ORGANISM="Chrysochromulina brevifilum, Strain UTEX LB 985" /LENGTH=90 /DNA_ID=CAMNT_0015928733 /DNA_START=78 /DNA_END=350 /DNA_ORIENTATION=+
MHIHHPQTVQHSTHPLCGAGSPLSHHTAALVPDAAVSLCKLLPAHASCVLSWITSPNAMPAYASPQGLKSALHTPHHPPSNEPTCWHPAD